jgi:hypothetical protein
MATESLIVTLSDGTTDYTFYKTSQSGSVMRFAYGSNSSTLKLFIDIDMRIANSGSKSSDTYTVTLRREAVDADTDKVVVSKVSLQFTVPKGDTIGADDIGNDASMLMCLMKNTFLDSFLLGIVQSGDYNVTGPFNPARA